MYMDFVDNYVVYIELVDMDMENMDMVDVDMVDVDMVDVDMVDYIVWIFDFRTIYLV